MKNIKDIASGGKYVPWETLAGSIDDNFTELNSGKLDKASISQSTGTSTTAVMSQKAVTDALELSVGTPTYTNYLTCSTASGTANKTVNILGFSANNKVRLLIKMTYATTVDANLAISAPTTVTKPLYYNGKRAGASNTWKAGAVLDIYYDGTNFQATDFQEKTKIIRLGNMREIVNAFIDGDWAHPNMEELFPIPLSEDKNFISDSILNNTIFTCDFMTDTGDDGSIIPINVEYANEQPYGGSPAYYDFSFIYNSTFYKFRIRLDGGSFNGEDDNCYLVQKDLSKLITDAPSDGKSYVRKNGGWTEEGSSSGVILSSIMYYGENTYSRHKNEILTEYDRIISFLENNERVLAQIEIDGPVNTSIGSDGNEHLSGKCTCDIYLIRDLESGSNLDRITGTIPHTTRLRTRSVYINRVTRDVQVIDENI